MWILHWIGFEELFRLLMLLDSIFYSFTSKTLNELQVVWKMKINCGMETLKRVENTWSSNVENNCHVFSKYPFALHSNCVSPFSFETCTMLVCIWMNWTGHSFFSLFLCQKKKVHILQEHLSFIYALSLYSRNSLQQYVWCTALANAFLYIRSWCAYFVFLHLHLIHLYMFLQW